MDVTLPFPIELIAAAKEPLIKLHRSPDGRPVGATACTHVAATPQRLWDVVSDVSHYPERVPMIDKVKIEGDRVTVHLKFKMSIVSAGFNFTAQMSTDPGRALELRWLSGEPKDIRLTINVLPYADGKESILVGSGTFDIHSLGWLVKYFLKHSPEIEFGIFPGVALGLIDAMERAAVKR